MRGFHADQTFACEPVPSVVGNGAISAVSINSQGREASVSAGATVTVNFTYNFGATGCQGCPAQIHIGAATGGAFACVAGMEGDAGTSSITFTVPPTPGLYYIGADWSSGSTARR